MLQTFKTNDKSAKFVLSSTRLTQFYNGKPFRYVKLRDVKTALNNPEGDGRSITAFYSRGNDVGGDTNAVEGPYTIHTGEYASGSSDPVSPATLSIGCMGFTKKNARKILQAIGLEKKPKNKKATTKKKTTRTRRTA